MNVWSSEPSFHGTNLFSPCYNNMAGKVWFFLFYPSAPHHQSVCYHNIFFSTQCYNSLFSQHPRKGSSSVSWLRNVVCSTRQRKSLHYIEYKSEYILLYIFLLLLHVENLELWWFWMCIVLISLTYLYILISKEKIGSLLLFLFYALYHWFSLFPHKIKMEKKRRILLLEV